ncbi:MAG TPA: hypothetical protein VEY10_06065 [Flavisolibacter sp.]|jgi:hypothetical protein|nr:hypothetical protein [Flavisolibacter sp.]
MKILFLFCFAAISMIVKAQTPQAMNYQAVARTSSGAIIPIQLVQVRFSVIEAGITGPVLYQETQYATTNNYGLFTLAIGKGTSATGTFSGINWASGTDKYLKVEIAPNGTNNFSLQGTTQLLSVPYALYSEKTKLIAGNAISIINGNTIAGSYTAGTGLNINGSTISHALQAGTGVAINGATIAHALKGAMGVRISADSIYHNLQAGNGIAINGATISHNFQAGTGINITGNTISSTGSGTSYWLPHNNGIYYNSGRVGIGMTPHPIVPLSVYMPNTNNGNAVLHLKSNDTYHSAISLFNGNTGSEKEFSMILAGPANRDMMPGSYGLLNHGPLTWSYNFHPTTNFMAIGSAGTTANVPKSRVHVFNGDVNIDQIGSGIIMKSPNGSCWRITVDNTGNLVRTAIACP